MNLMLIGFSGAGKSTLIQKLIQEKKLKVRGYVSGKVEKSGNENMTPVYIMQIPKQYKPKEDLRKLLEDSVNTTRQITANGCGKLDAAFTSFIQSHEAARCIGVSMDGHVYPDPEVLEDFAKNVLAPMAESAKPKDIIILDEIGVMESKSDTFRESVFRLLDGPATVVAAVREKHTDFLDQVKNHPNNTCFFVEENNRDDVYKEVIKFF